MHCGSGINEGCTFNNIENVYCLCEAITPNKRLRIHQASMFRKQIRLPKIHIQHIISHGNFTHMNESFKL